MKAQSLSIPYTPIFAALAAIVNTKLPQVGELLVKRLVMQFRRAYKRNDKAVCLSSATFISHLVNQQVVGETLAAMILLLLLNKPTDDSVEIAVGLTREVGQFLEEMNPPIGSAVFDQFRNILHEQDIDIRVQYMIEVLFQVRKDKYKDNPAIKDELDLVEEEDQITHRIGLEDEIDVEDGKNIFKFDPDWQENEDAYRKLKAEILGEAEGSDDGEGYESGESSDDEEAKEEREVEIKDQTNTDLVNLRRTICTSSSIILYSAMLTSIPRSHHYVISGLRRSRPQVDEGQFARWSRRRTAIYDYRNVQPRKNLRQVLRPHLRTLQPPQSSLERAIRKCIYPLL